MAVNEIVVVNTTNNVTVVDEVVSQTVVETIETKLVSVLAGQKGETGPANTLTIGTVTKSAAGGAASATITGTSPSQVLSLVLPTGDTGPANTLSVGTVTALIPSAAPTATITGTAPNQTLSLGIPSAAEWLQGAGVPAAGTGIQGDWYINTTTSDLYEKTSSTVWTLRLNIKGATGNTGPAPTLSSVIVTTGAAGSAGSGSWSGTNPYTLNLTVPRGDTGATGPAPTLNQPVVTQLAIGSTPTASFTGTNPYTLNLGIPIGANWLDGTAPPATGSGNIGDYYLITSGAGLGDVYKKTGASTWTLQGNIRGATGTGDLTGPASSTVNQLAIFADTTGKLLTNSTILSTDLVLTSGSQTIAGNKVFNTGIWAGPGASSGSLPSGGAAANFTPLFVSNATSGQAGVEVYVNDGTNNRRAGLVVNQTDAVWGLVHTATSGIVPFIINMAGTELMRITTGGFVGFGTTSPAATLHAYSQNAGTRVVTISGRGTVVTVTNKALTANVATLTTGSAHGFTVGRSVLIQGVDATFNGTYTIASAPTTTSFTYALTAADVASTAATGTAQSDVQTADLLRIEGGRSNSLITINNLGVPNFGVGIQLTGRTTLDNSIGLSGGSLYFEGAAGSSMYFRPNGAGNNTGMVTISTTGITSSGTGTSAFSGPVTATSFSGSSAGSRLATFTHTTNSADGVVLGNTTVDFSPRLFFQSSGGSNSMYRSAGQLDIRSGATPSVASGSTVIASFFDTGNVLFGYDVTVSGTITAGGTGFSGPGGNITGLNGTQITTGTVADARLSSNVVLLTGAQTLTGAKTFSGILTSNAGGAALALKPGTADHGYMEFYARTATPTVRSGYFGYPNAGSTALTLRNDISGGDIAISTNSGTVNVTGGLVVSGEITGATTGNVLKVGDDTRLVDINVAHVMGVVSQTDAAQGGIRLGSSYTISANAATGTITGTTFFTGGGSQIVLSSISPQLQWTDTDNAGAGRNYWWHNNGGQFYLLQDRTGNGSWENTYPMVVGATGSVTFGIGLVSTGPLTANGYTEIGALRERVGYLGNQTGTIGLDLNLYTAFELNQTGNITVSFTNLPASRAVTVTVTMYTSTGGLTHRQREQS